MLPAAVSTLLLLFVTASAAAWDEPDNFRGVAWGTSLKEAKALLESKGEKGRHQATRSTRDRH